MLCVLALLVASTQQTQFSSQSWPGEGRPVFVTTAATIRLHAQPSSASPIADSLVLPVGTAIEFSESRVVTLRSGLFVWDTPGPLTGRVFGPVTHLSVLDYVSKTGYDTLQLPAGAEVAYLQYRGEGTCFVMVEADVIDSRCPTRYAYARLVREPEIEWWIRIAVGEHARGWVRVKDSALREVRRTY
jgi:hypothetical protein